MTEAVRAVLEEGARDAPEVLDELVTAEWGQRYGRPVRLCSQPSHPVARLEQVGNDARELLQRPDDRFPRVARCRQPLPISRGLARCPLLHGATTARCRSASSGTVVPGGRTGHGEPPGHISGAQVALSVSDLAALHWTYAAGHMKCDSSFEAVVGWRGKVTSEGPVKECVASI